MRAFGRGERCTARFFNLCYFIVYLALFFSFPAGRPKGAGTPAARVSTIVRVCVTNGCRRRLRCAEKLYIAIVAKLFCLGLYVYGVEGACF